MINFKINDRINKKIAVIMVIIFITVILKAPTSVGAQTISLSIWPPLLETVIQPGKAVTQVFKLKNLGDDTVIHASIVPFEPGDDFGHISLVTPEVKEVHTSGVGYFSLQNADLNLPAIIPLKSGQTQEFVLKIKVPETAPEADHYLSFLFSADTEGLISASGTTTLGSIAANILLTVSQTGELKPTAKIEEFSVTRSDLKASTVPERNLIPFRNVIDSFDKINFILKLKNTSSVRLKAVGQVEVKNTFNRLVATLPLREDNVLAHSSRYLTSGENSKPGLGGTFSGIPWNPIFPLGRYTATAAITPQNTASTISQTIHFYVLPYKALLVIIILLSIYLLTKRKLSSHNVSK